MNTRAKTLGYIGETIESGFDFIKGNKIKSTPNINLSKISDPFNPTVVTKADDTKPIIKEYDIKPKDKPFIDFFSQENLDFTAPQTFAKQLVEAGTYAKSDKKQWWINALTQAGKSAKEYPDHPASINYNKLSNQAMSESGKIKSKEIPLEKIREGQAAGIKTQRLNRVNKYENLYNTMLDNNLTLDQAVSSAYKSETGKDIPKATKHDQILGAFWRIKDTLKNENPKVHKFFENEVKAYQIGEATNRKVKYGTKEYELARIELANTLGIDVKNLDRAHSIMNPRLKKLYNLLQEGKITRQDYERLQRPGRGKRYRWTCQATHGIRRRHGAIHGNGIGRTGP
jgi:hypothetical protein